MRLEHQSAVSLVACVVLLLLTLKKYPGGGERRVGVCMLVSTHMYEALTKVESHMGGQRPELDP